MPAGAGGCRPAERATTYEPFVFLHVIDAFIRLGTGAGIAFFMAVSNRSGDPALVAHTAGIVVLADTVFTATAALVQPVTGYLLARHAGWSLDGWIALALGFDVFVGLFWLPVVWMQLRLSGLACEARDGNPPLPPADHRLHRVWFAVGFPAFAAVLAIMWLMIAKAAIE